MKRVSISFSFSSNLSIEPRLPVWSNSLKTNQICLRAHSLSLMEGSKKPPLLGPLLSRSVPPSRALLAPPQLKPTCLTISPLLQGFLTKEVRWTPLSAFSLLTGIKSAITGSQCYPFDTASPISAPSTPNPSLQ
jgi:hypothetical protein